MLFNKNGFREFFAMQSNGQPRRVAYSINKDGQVVIEEVDGLPVTAEYPLPAQFTFIVHGWIDEHRRELSTHSGFYDIEGHRSAA